MDIKAGDVFVFLQDSSAWRVCRVDLGGHVQLRLVSPHQHCFMSHGLYVSLNVLFQSGWSRMDDFDVWVAEVRRNESQDSVQKG